MGSWAAAVVVAAVVSATVARRQSTSVYKQSPSARPSPRALTCTALVQPTARSACHCRRGTRAPYTPVAARRAELTAWRLGAWAEATAKVQVVLAQAAAAAEAETAMEVAMVSEAALAVVASSDRSSRHRRPCIAHIRIRRMSYRCTMKDTASSSTVAATGAEALSKVAAVAAETAAPVARLRLPSVCRRRKRRTEHSLGRCTCSNYTSWGTVS